MTEPLKRVAVTGPGGVLGRHMVARLIASGVEPIAIGRAHWDLRHWKTADELDALFGQVDAVVHCGAITPSPDAVLTMDALMDANVRACAALGAWATMRRVPVVFMGSAGIYAPSATAAAEDAPQADCPLGGFYGLTKLLAERLLAGMAADGLEVCTLRVTSLYGAGLHPAKMLAKMLAAADKGETIQLSAPADDSLNLVHAADVARAALLALQTRARGSFNIGGPAMVTIAEIARAAVAVTGRGSVRMPADAAARVAERRFHVSLARAEQVLGFTPAVTLAEGLTLMRNDSHVP